MPPVTLTATSRICLDTDSLASIEKNMASSFLFFPDKECGAPFGKNEGVFICHRETLNPNNAEDLLLYRALKENIISKEAFTPQKAMSSLSSAMKMRIANDPCSYCGVSVFTNEEEFIIFFQTPRMMKSFKFYTSGIINETKNGPLEQKPKPPHVTWHPYAQVAVEELFVDVKIIPEQESSNNSEVKNS